jgi:hypothetical protein
MQRHSRIFNRTRFDKNEIVAKEDHAEIVLYDKKGDEKARALISLNKVDCVKDFKWCLGGNGYVMCNTPKVLLHRFITKAVRGEIIDHANGSELDCRDENLRKCNKSQNAFNSKIGASNKSGAKGVHYIASKSRWGASIRVNGKNIILGKFKNKNDAIKVREEAEKQYFGEFMRGAIL